MPEHPPPANPIDALVGASTLAGRWIERLLAAHEPPLTVAQYLALRAVARERLVAADLARRTGVSSPAVSQLVSTLAEAGWLERTTTTDDRRRQELVLTPEGRSRLGSAEALLEEGIAPLLAALPRPELAALARLLPLLEAALAGTPPPRRPPPPPPPPEARPRGRR